MFAFVGVILFVVVGVHLYLWKRLVRDTMRPGPWRKLGGLMFLVLALLIPTTLILTRNGYAEWLAWPGYLWLALMFYLLVILIVLEVPRLVVRLVWRFTSPRGTTKPAGEGTNLADEGREDDRTAVAARSSSRSEGRTVSAGVARSGTAPVAAAGTAGASAAAGNLGSGAHGGSPDVGAAAGNVSSGAHGGSADGAEARDVPGGVDRRLVLARGAAVFAGLTAAGITGYGVRTALGEPQLDRVQIPMAKLPRAMDGTRLAVVSDIHLGPLTGPRQMSRIVEMINSVDADVVCIVGDMVDGSVAELGPSAVALRDIRSRHGAYFVTGNHEYYSGFQQWIDEVERLGVLPLRNERLQIVTRGGVFDLAGVNDLGGEQFGDPPDFERALGNRDSSRPIVLMAHQPKVARDAARYGVDLQVSGHTHGGQMVPFNLLVKLQQPIVSGFGKVDGVPVYVTNGAGFWGPPVRVGAPPQVTLIELRTT